MNSLTENSSITELFYAIDNISNDNNENDTILKEIVDEFCILLKEMENEKSAIQTMLKSYKEYLIGFYKMIKKQIAIIDSLFNESPTIDMLDVFVKLKKELAEYSMKMYTIEFLDMSSFLNEKECDIFKNIQIYSFLDKYYESIKKYETIQVNKNENIEQKDITTNSIDWKDYYYLVICMEKQRDFNQKLLSNFISSKENIDNVKFSVSNFCVADFQGQLSKSVFYQRKKLKLTQAKLSEISGVDRSMISKIEKLNQPTTLETAVKLLSALNMGIAICPFGRSEGKVEN